MKAFVSPLNLSLCLLCFVVLYITTYKASGAPHPIAALLLASVSGLGFLCLGKLLFFFEQTNKFGQLIVSRVTEAKSNWEIHPARSLIETGSWLGVTWGVYSKYGNILAAIELGSVCGIIVTFSAEAVLDELRSRQVIQEQDQWDQTPFGRDMLVNVLPTLCIFASVGMWIMDVIFGNLQHVLLASMLATLASVAFVVCGELFVSWKPTRNAGMVLISRHKHAVRNWQNHPYRSMFELSTWLVMIFSSYAHHGAIWSAIRHGTMAGVLVVLLDSCLLECTACHGEYCRSYWRAKDEGSPTSTARGQADGWAKGWTWMSPSRLGFDEWLAERAATTPVTPLSACTDADCEGLTSTRQNRKLTMAEIQQHNTESDCWVVIAGRVYDVSKWLPFHPGGAIIAKFAGADATDQFFALHRPHMAGKLRQLQIGICLEHEGKRGGEDSLSGLPATTADYRLLQLYLWEQGYFQVNWTYFLLKHLLLVVLFALSCYLAVSVDRLSSGGADAVSQASVWGVTVLAATALALFWQQTAFIAHDTMHNGILPPPGASSAAASEDHETPSSFFSANYFNPVSAPTEKALQTSAPPSRERKGVEKRLQTSRKDRGEGEGKKSKQKGLKGGENMHGWFLSSVLFGISGKMWLDEHNQHHAFTLRPCQDPQFDYLPMWLVHPKELAHTPHRPNAWMRFLVSIQHWTLIPLAMGIGRFNFYAINIFYAIKNGHHLDLFGMALYWTWHVALVAYIPSGKLRVAYVLISHILVGILHLQLMVSHLATDMLTKEEEQTLGFFECQARTSRNIKCLWWEHWFHGGLEWQLEHHLFPQLPRHNLASVAPLVIQLCSKHALPYRSVPFHTAVGECLQDFKATARALVLPELG